MAGSAGSDRAATRWTLDGNSLLGMVNIPDHRKCRSANTKHTVRNYTARLVRSGIGSVAAVIG